MTTNLVSMVDNKRGTLNRRIFADKELYAQELEQIFGRMWLFIGHETQIPKPNDFSAAYMGEDPILVTRDSKGKLHAFLNMCRHRGNRICRADFGNAPSFMCTYHGWTFATDGKLVGVPGYKEAYFEELDRSQWGLVEAAQIDTYKGLIWATWDKTAPILRDYIGDMAFYLDLVVDRREGGTEVLPGAYRWTINSNWKFGADNFAGDSYHTIVTHGSMSATRSANRPSLFGQQSVAVHAGNGHGVVGFYVGQGRNPQQTLDRSSLTTDYRMEHLPEMERRLGAARANQANMGVATMFPNFTWHGSPMIRLWQPRGPEKTEVWTYCIVDKDAPTEVKDAHRKGLTFLMGPSGNMDQDDMNNWQQCTAAGKMFMGKQFLINQQIGLGHERKHEFLPGTVAPGPSEQNQRAYYARWAEVMDASSWSDIKIAPRTT